MQARVRPKQSFHTPEYSQKKRARLIRRLLLAFGSLVVVMGGVVGLSHWSKIRIHTVVVEGTRILSADDIRTESLRFISGNYLYLLKKDNAVLYPRAALTRDLQIKYPRIQNIVVGLDNYHTIHIALSERQPFALWCGTTMNTLTTDGAVPQCYFVDRSGFVYSSAPDFSGDAYFKYYGLVPYASPVGSSYLSSSQKFTDLSNFVATVKSLNITPLYLVATSQDDFELYLYGGGTLIFDDHEPLSQTGEHLARLLSTANLVPQKNGELLVDYIDLRFGNKLYYKVRKAGSTARSASTGNVGNGTSTTAF